MITGTPKRCFYNTGSLFPMHLVLVRNGISEGTMALEQLRMSKDPFIVEKLINQHNSRWKLTPEGISQARAAGVWLKEKFPEGFDALMTGEYVRSLETSAYLAIPHAKWQKSLYLRPRDMGNLQRFCFDEHYTREEAEQLLEEKNRDRYYWTPPNGESLAQLALRAERVLHWLRHHIKPEGSALIVTHRDVMEAFRIEIEQISQLDYTEKIENPPKCMTLNYGSILQYTRKNPKTGEVVPTYRWVRVVTPPVTGAEPAGVKLYRRHNGNEELLAEVSDIPHLFSKKTLRAEAS